MGNTKEKDFQPPFEEAREGFSSEEIAEGIDRPSKSEIEDITDEASHRDPDGILRQTLRGDETKGDADERDAAGSSMYTTIATTIGSARVSPSAVDGLGTSPRNGE